MDLKITLTLSDRLFELLEDKLPSLGRRIETSISRDVKRAAERAVTKELGKTARGEMNVEVEAVPTPVPSVTADTAAQPAEATAEPAADAYPTLEACRAAIAAVRARIMGEDWEEHKDSELYRRYNRPITDQCKQIIMQLSGGNTRKLPELHEEKRAAFIAECEALTLDAEGNIITAPAPF